MTKTYYGSHVFASAGSGGTYYDAVTWANKDLRFIDDSDEDLIYEWQYNTFTLGRNTTCVNRLTVIQIDTQDVLTTCSTNIVVQTYSVNIKSNNIHFKQKQT